MTKTQETNNKSLHTECDPDTLRELLIQSHENSRALMDLRFKHFTTFLVLIALLGTVVFQIEDLKGIRVILAWVATSLSVLFWLLDHRTSQLYRIETNKASQYESFLKAPKISPPVIPKTISASKLTNIIFLIVVLPWIIIAIALGIVQP